MKAVKLFGCLLALVLLLAVSASANDISYVGSTLWNDVKDIQIDGHYCYCVMGYGLAVFDISNPLNPCIVYQDYFGKGGSSLLKTGDYLFVTKDV